MQVVKAEQDMDSALAADTQAAACSAYATTARTANASGVSTFCSFTSTFASNLPVWHVPGLLCDCRHHHGQSRQTAVDGCHLSDPAKHMQSALSASNCTYCICP